MYDRVGGCKNAMVPTTNWHLFERMPRKQEPERTIAAMIAKNDFANLDSIFAIGRQRGSNNNNRRKGE